MRKTKSFGVACFMLCVLILTASISMTASAYSEYIYLDGDGDGQKDTSLELNIDRNNYTAEIDYFDSYEETVVIPAVLDLREDDWQYWYDEYEAGYGHNVKPYTVTKINGSDEYNTTTKRIVIPPTVTYIAEETIGYHEVWEEKEYVDEDGYYEWEEIIYMKPVEGFTVVCVPGSAAEQYAGNSGFRCEYIKDISSASVTLSETSYTYTDDFIKPDVSVKYAGVTLTQGMDYEVLYYGNKYIGTASVVIVGIGDYSGSVTAEFEIAAIPASNVTVSKISTQYYDYGYPIEPYFNVSYNGEPLYCYEDYTYSFSSNTKPGKACLKITFKGKYTGTKKVYFTIVLEVPGSFNATAVSDTTGYLTWDYVPCTRYSIYRKTSKDGTYKYIGTTENTYYYDKKCKELTLYYYSIKAVLEDGSKKYTSDIDEEKIRTNPSTPTLSLVRKNKAATLKWTKNKKADGYLIYRCSNWDYEYKKVKTIRDNTVLKWTNTKLNNDYDYFYVIRAYKKVNGKTYYSDYSDSKYSGSSDARVNGASLKPHDSFKVYNVQGKSTSLMYTIKLSDSDKKLLDNFKKKHFKNGMTREEQLQVTLNWINQNVTYALGEDWDKISGKSWVEAIFKYKLGQCAQYNGAMAAMMAYLGYDVQVVMGYRGTWKTNYWQHFWVEVKIEGVTYIVETGNYGRSGSWSYLVNRYSEAGGYIKNQKNMG